MFTEILTHINWVDIVIILMVVRTIYIGVQTGTMVEFFKLLGIILAIFVSFHYYSELAKLLEDKLPVSLAWANVLCFVLLFSLVVLAFKFVREGIMLLMKAEAKANQTVDQVGGLIIGLLRVALMASVLLVFLQISGFDYFRKNEHKALARPYLGHLAPQVYTVIYNGIVSKIFPSETLNPTVSKKVD